MSLYPDMFYNKNDQLGYQKSVTVTGVTVSGQVCIYITALWARDRTNSNRRPEHYRLGKLSNGVQFNHSAGFRDIRVYLSEKLSCLMVYECRRVCFPDTTPTTFGRRYHGGKIGGENIATSQ